MSALYREVARYALSFYAPATRYRIAEHICGDKPHGLPGDMLMQIRKRRGRKALLAADSILFGWCLLFCVLLDILPLRPLLRDTVGTLVCLAAFCLCRDSHERCLLKLGFLAFSFYSGFFWALTCLTMIVFEHLAVADAPLNLRRT